MATAPQGIVNLKGKKGLVVGIANEQSIAYGGAKIFHAAGAELTITYLNEKAKKHVEPLAEKLDCKHFSYNCNIIALFLTTLRTKPL